MKKIIYYKSKKIRFAEDPVWYTCPGCGTGYCNGSGICPVCRRNNK